MRQQASLPGQPGNAGSNPAMRSHLAATHPRTIEADAQAMRDNNSTTQASQHEAPQGSPKQDHAHKSQPVLVGMTKGLWQARAVSHPGSRPGRAQRKQPGTTQGGGHTTCPPPTNEDTDGTTTNSPGNASSTTTKTAHPAGGADSQCSKTKTATTTKNH